MIERKDNIRNKAKVSRALIKDPSLTQREVAKKTWLSNWTVHNQMTKIKQKWAEGSVMDRILEQDEEIMDLVNSLTVKHIKTKVENNESLDTWEVKLLWDLANNSTKRTAIFWKKDEWEEKAIQFIIS